MSEKNNINKVREKRRKRNDNLEISNTQEFFTPIDLVNHMLDKLPEDSFTDFSKTFLEPSAGNGNFVVAFLERRLQHCKSDQDILSALSTIYAVELMQDNVDEMKERIKEQCIMKFNNLYVFDNDKCIEYKDIESQLLNFIENSERIIDHNIVCSDFFKWDFDNWRPIKEVKSISLF